MKVNQNLSQKFVEKLYFYQKWAQNWTICRFFFFWEKLRHRVIYVVPQKSYWNLKNKTKVHLECCRKKFWSIKNEFKIELFKNFHLKEAAAHSGFGNSSKGVLKFKNKSKFHSKICGTNHDLSKISSKWNELSNFPKENKLQHYIMFVIPKNCTEIWKSNKLSLKNVSKKFWSIKN